MLELLYACGLRVSELATLRLGSLHLADGFVVVKGKGSKERVVPVADSSARWVLRWVTGPRAAKRGAASSPWLFPGAGSRPVTRQTVFLALKAAARKAGLDPEAVLAPRPAALLRDAPRRRRGRPEGRPDDAGAREHRDDGDLHPRLEGAGAEASTTGATRVRRAFLAVAICALFLAGPGEAALVVLEEGRHLKVTSFELVGEERIRLVRSTAGERSSCRSSASSGSWTTRSTRGTSSSPRKRSRRPPARGCRSGRPPAGRTPRRPGSPRSSRRRRRRTVSTRPSSRP